MKSSFALKLLLSVFFCLLFESCLHSQVTNLKESGKEGSCQCLPCGYDCDKKTYNEPGECPSCHMQLVKKSSVVFKTIEPSAICAYIKNHPDVVLLDVRTKEEFEGKANPDFGTLKNAVNIPVQELKARLPEIRHLKNKEIIVYCSHSHRSPQASYLLTQNGLPM